jgi:hypothetical protein
MHEVDQANRRTHGRRSVRIRAQLTSGTDMIEGTVENIGEGGVFFATQILDADLDDGATTALTFRCLRNGTEELVERTATILRAERYFDGEVVVRAFAMRFDRAFALDGVEFE